MSSVYKQLDVQISEFYVGKCKVVATKRVIKDINKMNLVPYADYCFNSSPWCYRVGISLKNNKQISNPPVKESRCFFG